MRGNNKALCNYLSTLSITTVQDSIGAVSNRSGLFAPTYCIFLEIRCGTKMASVHHYFSETRGRLQPCGPLSRSPNKHPYLFSPGRIAAEATGPCRREISSYRWRLSPGQGSKVTVGGGGAAEQQSGKETGGLPGSVWALLSRQRQAARNLIEYLARPLVSRSFHQHGLFYARTLEILSV